MQRMKNSITILLVLTMFVSVFYVFLPCDVCSASSVFHVYSGESIQDVISAANTSSTIYVHTGTYTENLIVNKAITLIGDGISSVTLNGNGGHTVTVNNYSIDISGFTIKNPDDQKFCIFLSSASNCIIEGNKIKNGGYGVYLQ